VNFGIRPGSLVGIVGAIGSGKTTLARLLVGIQKPTRGDIRIDGTEAADWDRDQLGRYIGYLPQDIGLFAGTVAENIGRLGLFDDGQIVAAAELAGAHEIISKLPQGYDTLIGEGGVPLSGGQKQLIGLARAVIGSPSLVVLDEPNSNLDGPGENALLRCVQSLKQIGSTVILISHRPSIVQTLERVILIKEGSVAFDGKVEDFFEASGRPAIRVIKSAEAQT
jgi:ABC-type protease/lipase transport system fused ATPase/permease subunit